MNKVKHRNCDAFFLLNDTYSRYFAMKKDEKLIALGRIVRSKRERKGLTQIEVANRSMLDRNYIGMIERGERNPSYLSLLKIASGLGLSVDELLKP